MTGPDDPTDPRPPGARVADGHAGDLLSAHLDGELDADADAWVVAHLAVCDACRSTAERVAAVRSWVRSLPVVDATPVVEGVLARHRALIRAGAGFVGVAAIVLGALALTSTLIRPDVVPEVDALVAAHESQVAAGDGAVWSTTGIDAMTGARRVESVERPYAAPPAMIGNRARLSRHVVYDGHDLALVVYGDGTTTVSVFQQPGRLQWSGLPAGTVERIGEHDVWVDDSRHDVVMVAELGHLVVTVVSDDRAAATTVLDGLDAEPRQGIGEHLHDACIRFTEVFSAEL